MISFELYSEIIESNPFSYEEFVELDIDRLRIFCQKHLNMCRSMGFNPSTQPMLQDISAAGVTLDSDGLYEEADSTLLLDTFLHLSNAGFVFDPDFVIDPLSFEVGRDILNEDRVTDVIIAAYLNDHGTRRTMFSSTEEWFYPHLEKVKAGDAQIANTAVSPKSYEPDAWSKKAVDAGVKVIVNNNDCDLSPDRFKSDQHHVIVPQERSWRANEHDKSGKNSYVFQDEYFVSMLPTLNEVSPLSRKMIQAALHEEIITDSSPHLNFSM